MYFKRPEGTEKDVAELDVLRNCACSLLQHEQLSTGENMLAASDVARSKNSLSSETNRDIRQRGIDHVICVTHGAEDRSEKNHAQEMTYQG